MALRPQSIASRNLSPPGPLGFIASCQKRDEDGPYFDETKEVEALADP
jgi:hypothetical protein